MSSLRPAPAFTIREAFRFGATHLLRNLPLFVAIEVAYVAVWAGIELAVFELAPIPGSFGHLVIHLLWLFLASIPEAAMLGIALRIRESGSWSRDDLVAALHRAPQLFVVKTIYLLTIALGVVLLVVPGAYLAVRYSPCGFVVAEGERDSLAVLRRSGSLTRGVLWRLLGFGLVAIGVNAVGAALLGVGFVLSLPLTALAAAFVFDALRKRSYQGGDQAVPSPGP